MCALKKDGGIIYWDDRGIFNYFLFLFHSFCSGPCPQSSPRVLLDCSSNSALVSWTPGYGVLYYNASAVALDVGEHVNCSTTGFSCNVTQLQCAQSYMISVSGQGYTCPSPSQGWVLITSGNRSLKYQSWCQYSTLLPSFFRWKRSFLYTLFVYSFYVQNFLFYSYFAGPCPPNQVYVQLPCASNVMSVSWQISQGSVSYLAVAQSSGGLMFNCSSNGTTCDIPGLQCGQTYEVYVSGVVGTCIGPKSLSQIVKTGELGHQFLRYHPLSQIMNMSHLISE